MSVALNGYVDTGEIGEMVLSVLFFFNYTVLSTAFSPKDFPYRELKSFKLLSH